MAETESPAPDAAKPGLLDDWMSRQELANELGVSVRTLQQWQLERIGPPMIRLKKKTFYRREAVLEWLRSQEMPSGLGRRK